MGDLDVLRLIFIRSLDSTNLFSTFPDKTPCSSVVSPCKNGGTCYEEKGYFRCICTREWKGKDCSESMIFVVVVCRDYVVINHFGWWFLLQRYKI